MNSTRSKLLYIRQSITNNVKDTPIIQTPPMTASSDIECEPLAKHKRSEEADQLTEEEFTNTDHKSDQEELKKPTKKINHKKIPHEIKQKTKIALLELHVLKTQLI
ncbi:17992_t:CDS:1 [Dentiscutata erythropus]|uniref:17992_t:CDS:1 n=1 Tax=Dentiscutata erythropus TaxID=1348616 RepID=A0A9N8V6C4_9GLOM|nr:17992_t:CDS:1 [Dentiscutata erythropus]